MNYSRGWEIGAQPAGSWRWLAAALVWVVLVAGCAAGDEDTVSGNSSALARSQGVHADSRSSEKGERRSPPGQPRCGGPGPGQGAGGNSGGAGGRGGVSGLGGHAGLGGASGGGGTPALCTGVPPFSANVTAPGGFPVGTYTFATGTLVAPDLTPTFASNGALTALQVSFAPGTTTDPMNDVVGFGFGFPGCVDASAFTGVRFTLSGDPGTCSVRFQPVDTERNSVLYGGSCLASNCYAGFSDPLSLGTTTVRFSDLVGGNPPQSLDVTRLMDLSWSLVVPVDGVTAPCQGALTVTDIAFVN